MKPFTQESLRIIKKASEDNKLVIVVGAGVSMLSKFPSWKEVIDRFSGPFSEQKDCYSQNEYLRIPQKYYNLRGHKEYYDLLREIFDLDLQSHQIHDEILNLNPIHLITTNYDDLLEKAIDVRGLFYDVIAKDEEVSQTRTKHFLIKMHGDVKHQNVVLKENDYLSYSSQFRLVETMVKSIIASNITLFIGYSLNDRNMKLILNWVKELQGSSFQPVYLLYLEQTLDQNNFDYYKSQGIHVIDVNYLLTDNQEATYEERYLSFFQAISKLNLDDLYQNHPDEEQFRYQLAPLDELSRVRLKDLRHLIKEEISETGILKLSTPYPLDLITCSRLKKAGVQAVVFPDCSFHQITSEEKNYLLSPYTSLLTECTNQGEGVWQNYHRAYYQFKQGNLLFAYELYKKTAAEAFKSKQYLLHFLAQFNRYWTGRTIQRVLSQEEAEVLADEIRQLNLELIYHRLPASFKRKYGFLSDLTNFYFIYEYLNDMIGLINELSPTNDSLDRLNYRGQELFEFMHENLLVIDDYLEVSHLYKSYIEARIQHDKASLDSFTLCLIIKYMSVSEIDHLMQRFHRTHLKTSYVCELISYYERLLTIKLNSVPPLTKNQIQRMRAVTLTLLSMMELREDELFKVIQLLFSSLSHQLTMNECLSFLKVQASPVMFESNQIQSFLKAQFMHLFIKKNLLNETVDLSYKELISFISGDLSNLQSLIELYFKQMDLLELITLSLRLDDEVKERVRQHLVTQLEQNFNFEVLTQAFQEDFPLPYQRFSESIQQHLSQTPTDVFQVALWIACRDLERELFEDYLRKDERSYFITHDEEIEVLPLEKNWFWQLPTFIHEKLAQRKHREEITTALINKIRTEQVEGQLLNLYFDIYQR